MRQLLTAVLVLALAASAAAQTVTTYTDRIVATTRQVIGSSTFGTGPLRVVGLSARTGTTSPVWADAAGDFYTGAILETDITDGSVLARLAANETVSGSWTFSNAIAANGGITVDSTAFTVADTSGNTSVGGTLGVTGTTTIGDSANLTRSTYASQTTGWRVSSDGGADFRYLFVDEMHAKSFIADLEQALAGGQIIAKSVAMVGQAFTCPAASGTSTLWVRDLPSMANTAAFVANDWVVLRTFSRAAGALTVSECVGQVSSYADGTAGNDGQQSWTFTRGSGGCEGGMTASATVAVDALALDFGASGNGYAEVTAVDGTYGANSPYYQVVTWATCPVAANRSVRARWGNLSGAYGYSAGSGVFGFAAGDASAAHITIDPTDGMRFRNGTTTYGSFTGTTLTLGKTAEEYLTIDPTNGVRFLNNGAVQAQLNSTTLTLGATDQEYITIDPTNGLRFLNNGVVLGQLTSSTLTLGQPLTANNTGQMVIDSDSIDFEWRDNSGTTSTIFEVVNNGGAGQINVAGRITSSVDVQSPYFTYAGGDMTIYTTGTGNAILVRTTGGGALRPYTDNLTQLGNTTTQWASVWSEAYYVGTTAGASGTCASVTVVNGIVTGCTP